MTLISALPVADAAGPAWPGLDARVHGLRVQRIAVAMRKLGAGSTSRLSVSNLA
jgi:hypothetical protein